MVDSDQIVKTVRWLEKFRKSILLILLMLLAVTCIVYYKADFLIYMASKPLNGMQLFFLAPVEGIVTKIEISFFGGLIIAFPVIIAIGLFIAKNRLSKSLWRFLLFFIIPFATAAFWGGMAFAYKLVLPSTIKFLLSSAEGLMTPLLSAKSYFSFVFFFIITTGLIFELPLVLVALSRLGVVTSKGLMSKRRVAIIVTIIIMALLTPTPDAFTLIAVSLPMVVLYEISIWWIFILEKLEMRKGVS